MSPPDASDLLVEAASRQAVPPPAVTSRQKDESPPASDPPGERARPMPAVETLSGAGLRQRRSLPRPIRRLFGPVLLLTIWQVGSVVGYIPEDTIAAPSAVAGTGWDMIVDGSLPEALAVSLRRVGYGLVLGGLAGLALGLLSGLFRLGEDLIDAPMQMLRTVPFLGLIPLLIIWFGIGEAPKIALVTLAVAFPLYLNTYAAIRDVDERLVEAAGTLGLNRWQLVWHVVLPGSLPGMLVGLRYALGFSWLALVIGEQVNADQGIGYLMMNAREFLQTDVIVVCLVVYSLLGLLTDVVVRLLENGALSWRRGFSGQ